MYPLEIKRILDITIPKNPLKGSGAAFLWGPRGTGKTTCLKQKYPDAKYYDLLQTDIVADLTLHPYHLREEILAQKPPMVIMDEVQKIPALLDEIHWLLENRPTLFILCGSSARKLKREGKNLLGGRAVSYQLFPFTSIEIENFNLDKALQFGTVPRHYLSDSPRPLLNAYINNYLKEEVIDEALIRNVPSFAEFLKTVALTHGQLLNYANVAREVGVSPSTVRAYYRILEDTLVGHRLEPWKKKKDRRLIETEKFYLFDVGVANHLHPEIREVVPGTDIYGNAFEHFLIEEIRAFLSYKGRDDPLTFWRTTTGYEVDIIIGSMAVALEFKSAKKVTEGHLKGMKALLEEHKVGRACLVSQEEVHRKTTQGIELIHWKMFCEKLWSGEFLS
ncbi:MAG: ATP-binding protein [Deltaproteobacteria bacterium]|nr:ATP-binding protein [Deltaproteobacteria bacterium]